MPLLMPQSINSIQLFILDHAGPVPSFRTATRSPLCAASHPPLQILHRHLSARVYPPQG